VEDFQVEAQLVGGHLDVLLRDHDLPGRDLPDRDLPGRGLLDPVPRGQAFAQRISSVHRG
jgi:hypothetical protein